jgi:hypothetical protein
MTIKTAFEALKQAIALENAKHRTKIDIQQWIEWEELEQAIAALPAAGDGVRDSERLDYLIDHGYVVVQTGIVYRLYDCKARIYVNGEQFETPREAIDAAIDAEKR